MNFVIPEWIWVILVGGIIVGLIKALWGGRNQGFLSAEAHGNLCAKNREEICMDIDRMAESFGKSLDAQSENIKLLINTKFDNLDDKIENKIFKELRLLGNGGRYVKARAIRKKK